MPEQSSEATVVAEDPAPETELGEEQTTETQEAGKTSLAALFEAAEEDGHTIGIAEPSKADTDTDPDTATDDSGTPEDGVPEGADAKPPVAIEETEPPKGLSISEQVAWYKDKGEKAPWYLERISEQSATLAKRTERLEKAERDRDAALAEVQKRSGPQPTAEQPFADITDPKDLDRLEQTYKGILRIAIDNPNGADGVVLGKNADGSDRIEDLDAGQMTDLRTKCDRALTLDIPERRRFLRDSNERFAEYKVARAKADADAFQKYPEFKDGENPMTKEAIALLKANPNLEVVLGPEVIIHLGRYLKGKALEAGANGNGQDATSRILRSATTRIAPTTTKTRSMPERKGADVASAKKQLEEQGTQDAALAYVNAVLHPKRGTAKPIGSAA